MYHQKKISKNFGIEQVNLHINVSAGIYLILAYYKNKIFISKLYTMSYNMMQLIP